ncbi:MAG TPA: hypothetical protein VNJ29_03305 [Candidatus Nitrosotenuis sp.]|nr:hypothetical protein [Candidatus Nitrosotenuis sp.]
MRYFSIVMMWLLSGCTWSFTNVCTHGSASDVVDSTPTENNDIKPNTSVQIPLTP